MVLKTSKDSIETCPLISVIIPVYNVKPYLSKCLDSVLSQTYTNLEIILVDDGSTDGSELIVDEYAKKDARIKVIHKSNGGLSDARNKALDIVQGDYIAFVDSDDCIHPKMYEFLLTNAQKYDCKLSTCQAAPTKDFNKTLFELNGNLEVFPIDKVFSFFFVNQKIDVAVWNKLFEKSLFDGIRFPKGKIYEDEHIIYDLIKRCPKIVISEDKLYSYYIRPNSISNVFTKNTWVQRFEASMHSLAIAKETGCQQDYFNWIYYWAYDFKRKCNSKDYKELACEINSDIRSILYLNQNKIMSIRVWVFLHLFKLNIALGELRYWFKQRFSKK